MWILVFVMMNGQVAFQEFPTVEACRNAVDRIGHVLAVQDEEVTRMLGQLPERTAYGGSGACISKETGLLDPESIRSFHR
jgi:hypothetical protein